VDPLGQGHVAEPRILLEQAQQSQVEVVEGKICHIPAPVGEQCGNMA
jgi:hypothetical protein